MRTGGIGGLGGSEGWGDWKDGMPDDGEIPERNRRLHVLGQVRQVWFVGKTGVRVSAGEEGGNQVTDAGLVRGWVSEEGKNVGST